MDEHKGPCFWLEFGWNTWTPLATPWSLSKCDPVTSNHVTWHQEKGISNLKVWARCTSKSLTTHMFLLQMLLLMDQNSYNGRWNCCISHWVFSFLKPSSNWLCSDELSHLVTKPTFQPLRIPGWRSLHHVVCLRARFGGLSMRGRVYGSEAWWNEAKFHEICISHDRIHGTNGIFTYMNGWFLL